MKERERIVFTGVLIVLLLAVGGLIATRPTGLVPPEDQGYVLAVVSLPPDLGAIDAQGFVTITGRLKDIIIRGGENISSVEIENAFNVTLDTDDIIGMSDVSKAVEILKKVRRFSPALRYVASRSGRN
jgi:hypothetical protein